MRKFIFLLLSVFAVHYIFAGGVVVLAHEGGYTTALANHLKRWLSIEGVQSAVHTPSSMSGALAKARLAFLVGFNEPTKAEMKALTAFRERGGKLVVFHSASPQLGRLMGVIPLGYTKARYPGCWSRMDFNTKMPGGLPVSVRQSSTVLQRALPVKGQGRVIATWSDRQGRSTGDAAWIATSGGFWMTHVLLADGDEDLKARLLGAIVGSIDSRLWNFSRHLSREMARKEATRRFALEQTSHPGEIHAVWDHSGCGLYPGDWPRTMKTLQASRVTDLFVNVAGAGFAHYPSDVLPRSKTYEQEGDQLKACIEAGRKANIRVHAWVLCFTATRSSPAVLDSFAKRGWRLKTKSGKLSEYLDPSNSAVRAHILSVIDEIQVKYPAVSGIHLDFVRWYEQSVKPKDAAQVFSKFVASAKRRVARPRWFTTAVLGKYPQCVNSVGQDWTSWIDANLVDYVVPMDYTENSNTFEEYLKQHAALKTRARRTIAGIGVTANESRLSPLQVINQIRLARKYNMAGVALFDLDRTLEVTILPYLRLGLW
jgi:uncharacterized lipoprotein YddW (UPF0748 family)